MIEPAYIEQSAAFDESGMYRYNLVRRWAPGPSVLWIMLNPSTADELKLDPTLQRCLHFSMTWDVPGVRGTHGCLTHACCTGTYEDCDTSTRFGAFEVCNLYAFRSSNPDDLWFPRTVILEDGDTITIPAPKDPVGPENDAAIVAAVRRSRLVIAGWGDGAKPDRERRIAQMLADLGVQPYTLRLTSSGAPSHPLARGKSRIPNTATPIPWHAKGLR